MSGERTLYLVPRVGPADDLLAGPFARGDPTGRIHHQGTTIPDSALNLVSIVWEPNDWRLRDLFEAAPGVLPLGDPWEAPTADVR